MANLAADLIDAVENLAGAVELNNQLYRENTERMAKFSSVPYTPSAYSVEITAKVWREDDLFQPNETHATFRGRGDDLGIAASAAATSLNAWLQREVETVYQIAGEEDAAVEDADEGAVPGDSTGPDAG